jgi:hypothetical protein
LLISEVPVFELIPESFSNEYNISRETNKEQWLF